MQLRRWVRLIRPAATATVYRRLTTLAAEEAQVDWGAFGSIRIGRGVRPLSGFVMVLSYSRAIFAPAYSRSSTTSARRNSGPLLPRAVERDALGAGAIAHLPRNASATARPEAADPNGAPGLPECPRTRSHPHRLETYDELARAKSDDPEQ